MSIKVNRKDVGFYVVEYNNQKFGILNIKPNFWELYKDRERIIFYTTKRACVQHIINWYSIEYNGWSNYETWVTGLWIDNDEKSYNNIREQILNAKAPAWGIWYLKRFAMGYVYRNGLKGDITKRDFRLVNWREIYNSLLEE